MTSIETPLDRDIERERELQAQELAKIQPYSSEENGVVVIIYILWAILLPFTIWTSFKSVSQAERGFKFRLGKSVTGAKALLPGLHFVLPWVDSIIKIDMRTRVDDIEPQSLLTSDSVTLKIDGIGFWRVSEPWKAYTRADNFEEVTCQLLSATLRNVLSGKSLRTILSSRRQIADDVVRFAAPKAAEWGVTILNVEISDVQVPEDLQESLAAEAQAAREAAAKVALAKGELDSAKLLAEAARNLANGGAGAMAIRYLETMNSLNKGNFIIYPE